MPAIVTLTMNPAIDKSTGVAHVTPERKLRCRTPQFEPGGGGINVARATHELGGEALAMFPTGGPTGQLLKTLLENQKCSQKPFESRGWTRENLTVYEETSDREFRFTMPGARLEKEEWRRCLDMLAELAPKPDYIVASGSLPPGVPDDFYGQVAHMSGELNARFVLDTSGQPMKEAMGKGLFLIKPNLRELEDLSGDKVQNDGQLADTANRLVEEGKSEIIVVSMGAAGLFAAWRDGSKRLSAPTVPIKSRVGAGDSMVAGMVLRLSQGENLDDALRFGLAAGAAAVMSPGTALCNRNDTERLYECLREENGTCEETE